MKRIIAAARSGSRWRAALLVGALCSAVVATAVPLAANAAASAAGAARHARTASASTSCTSATCTFPLSVNPGLEAGAAFACPAIQHATGSIVVTNRFARDAQNDEMTLTASGLPKSTGFDLFLVQSSPLDSGFSGFGFGWYQSDVNSNSSGHASVVVRGIFDKETFIENPSSAFTPIHTFDVGFWFSSPKQEAAKCGSGVPTATPFNGEQDAGLNAMITSGEPLGLIK
jgi:hypothetical protein